MCSWHRLPRLRRTPHERATERAPSFATARDAPETSLTSAGHAEPPSTVASLTVFSHPLALAASPFPLATSPFPLSTTTHVFVHGGLPLRVRRRL